MMPDTPRGGAGCEEGHSTPGLSTSPSNSRATGGRGRREGRAGHRLLTPESHPKAWCPAHSGLSRKIQACRARVKSQAQPLAAV